MKNSLRPVRLQVYAVVLVSTPGQWSFVEKQFPNTRPGVFRGRQFFSRNFGTKRVVFLRAGEGEVHAAAATQFGIDRWNPLVVMSTAEQDDPALSAISQVCELNGVRLVSETIAAASIGDSVPAAIVKAGKEG